MNSLVHRPRVATGFGIVALMGMTLAGCTGDDGRVAAAGPQNAAESTNPAASAAAAAMAPNPLRNVYFGDLHTHTNFSYDAFLNGTRATPDDAYRYAQGEPLTHAAGFEIRLDRPLDFFAVTDHASFLGMLPAMLDPEQEASRHPAAELARRIAAGELTGADRGGCVRRHPGPHPGGARGPARPERGALRLARDHSRGRAPQRPGPLHHLHRLRVHPAVPRTRTCTAT